MQSALAGTRVACSEEVWVAVFGGVGTSGAVSYVCKASPGRPGRHGYGVQRMEDGGRVVVLTDAQETRRLLGVPCTVPVKLRFDGGSLVTRVDQPDSEGEVP